MKREVLGPIGLLAALAIGVWFYFTWFYFTPHLAMRDLKAAVDARDAVKLAAYVNFPALKESLKATFNAKLKLKCMDPSDPKKDRVTELACKILARMIGPMIDWLVTPEGLAMMMQGVKPILGETPTSPSHEAPGKEVSHAYETFDRFVVTIKNTADADPVQLVLSRDGLFSWKLSAIRF